MKCNKLNNIDHKYLQGYDADWYFISCCNKIFPLETLTKKTSYLWETLFLVIVPVLLRSDNINISRTRFLQLKPSSNLSKFNNFCFEPDNDSENVTNTNYCAFDQFQALPLLEKYYS